MLRRRFSTKSGITTRSALANVILISNAFIWYSLAFNTLKGLIDESAPAIWAVHFTGTILSAIVGAALSAKARKKDTFLAIWIVFGMISSLILVSANSTSTLSVLVVSLLFGVSFGFGLPASMGCFADCTSAENRATLGGLVLLVNGLGAFLLGLTAVNDIMLQALTLAIWRGSGLIFFLAANARQQAVKKRRSVTFSNILTQRAFVLYIIPWTMFSLVNFLSVPVQSKILNPDQVELFVTIESALAGAFAIVGGFLSDIVGRKRIAMTGFIMLGLGYAILGVYPERANLLGWYFYTLVDGVAWGVFYVIFITTVWGDLSHDSPSDKYYAIGGLPFFISNFLRIIIGEYIAEIVPGYAIFSLTAFFLFLAVVPLTYAPETLPEKKIRERELKKYIEKAKKIKEKFD